MDDAKKRATILVLILFTVGSLLVVADSFKFSPTGMVTAELSTYEQAMQNTDALKDLYNQNLDKVPKFVRTVFGNEKILLEIDMLDGNTNSMSLQTEKGRIKTLTKEKLSEYTLKIRTSEKTINEIMVSEDQVTRFKQAIDNKEITYEALRMRTSVKVGMSKMFLSMSNWFK